MYTVNGKTYPCCTSVTMGIIGGKWKTVILFQLLEGELRYNQLRKSMMTVTERTLSLQLKALESDGVIDRRVEGNKAPFKVSYRLTSFGETLAPVITAIAHWGDFAVKHTSEKPQEA